MHPPNTNVNLTFHPNGTVTQAIFTVPATFRRSATLTEDSSQIDSHRGPGVGMGTGDGRPVHDELHRHPGLGRRVRLD